MNSTTQSAAADANSSSSMEDQNVQQQNNNTENNPNDDAMSDDQQTPTPAPLPTATAPRAADQHNNCTYQMELSDLPAVSPCILHACSGGLRLLLYLNSVFPCMIHGWMTHRM